jgi:LemA protein
MAAGAKAASNPADAGAIRGLAGAEGQLSGALGRLFAVFENYPDLKGNQTMMQLMEELTSTENKVSFSRQAFNDAVTQYNIAREVFPNSVIAGMFAFQPAVLFEVENPAEKEAIRVTF